PVRTGRAGLIRRSGGRCTPPPTGNGCCDRWPGRALRATLEDHRRGAAHRCGPPHRLLPEGTVSPMSLETTRSDSAAERMSAQEARQRLEHERDSRLEQLRAIEESANGGQEAADLLKAQKSTLQRALKD